MALDALVDSTQLNADLTSVADAIREKGGTSAELAFPTDFVSAIEAISGGGMTLLASGDYVVSSDLGTGNMVIPVSVSSAPMMILVAKDTPRSGTQQTFAWVRFLNNIPTEISTLFGATTELLYTNSTTATYYAVKGNSNATPLTVDSFSSPTKLTCVRYSNNYPIKADTYHWYIWGTA